MQINADFSRRAVVNTASLPWVPSPLPGVERRMLDRDGGEVARATSLVRYAPRSRFPEHVHSLGEELLVLAGTFSDESGDYGAGMYVRNPPGSRHAPACKEGCLIFVKLRQMHPDDAVDVRIDTADPSLWREARSGERRLQLFSGPFEQVVMLNWTAGTRLPLESFPGGAEYLVIDGCFEDADGVYPAGTWLRLPCGSKQAMAVMEDTKVYRKTGHLAAIGGAVNDFKGTSRTHARTAGP